MGGPELKNIMWGPRERLMRDLAVEPVSYSLEIKEMQKQPKSSLGEEKYACRAEVETTLPFGP